jgi:hypothetical protein
MYAYIHTYIYILKHIYSCSIQVRALSLSLCIYTYIYRERASERERERERVRDRRGSGAPVCSEGTYRLLVVMQREAIYIERHTGSVLRKCARTAFGRKIKKIVVKN